MVPDVTIELDPRAWRKGHDVQLEKAVAVALDERAGYPSAHPHVPPFPDYSRYAR